ncbi:hypothetical protein DFH07DRAFT_775203 [Mycena maculata]|uniref:Uncharacterized protein n=1 Tax=Mycena maculata TaxID=230809 RepID=A0AAD7IWA8_9AGAR|nr:hypothetical protein DFH07DRAFT_775203 [Mycena maculata]
MWHHPCSGFMRPLLARHPVSLHVGRGTLPSVDAAEAKAAEDTEVEAEVEVEVGKEADTQHTSGMVSDSDLDSGCRVEGDRGGCTKHLNRMEKKEHTLSPWSGAGKCTALGIPTSLPAPPSPSSLHVMLGPAPMRGVDGAECTHRWCECTCSTLLDEFSGVLFKRRMSAVLTVHAVPGGRTGRSVVGACESNAARQKWMTAAGELYDGSDGEARQMMSCLDGVAVAARVWAWEQMRRGRGWLVKVTKGLKVLAMSWFCGAYTCITRAKVLPSEVEADSKRHSAVMNQFQWDFAAAKVPKGKAERPVDPIFYSSMSGSIAPSAGMAGRALPTGARRGNIRDPG